MTKVEYEKVVDAWAKLNVLVGVLDSAQRKETEAFLGSEWLDSNGEFVCDKLVSFCYKRTLESYALLDQLVSKRRA